VRHVVDGRAWLGWCAVYGTLLASVSGLFVVIATFEAAVAFLITRQDKEGKDGAQSDGDADYA
jgi:hypothetical protein